MALDGLAKEDHGEIEDHRMKRGPVEQVVQAPVGLTFVTYENPPGIHTATERIRAFKT
jgi:hypothetical protein